MAVELSELGKAEFEFECAEVTSVKKAREEDNKKSGCCDKNLVKVNQESISAARHLGRGGLDGRA